MVFNEYAHYYDLLYKDKDYSGEANYIDGLIKKYRPGARTILDLGCGTGKHAALLAQRGYKVHGIDRSVEMLKEAEKRSAQYDNLSFSQADIQDFHGNEKYDVVTALFHVMSYQTTDAAVECVMQNVRDSLDEKGIFIFDVWYGPAVLMEKPEIRIKRLENEQVRVTRIAEPVLKENENIVEVNYDIFVEDRRNKDVKEFKEKHVMRYFFKNEINGYMEQAGLQCIDCFAFMGSESLGRKTWGACFIGCLK